jgi:hypothetical protein
MPEIEQANAPGKPNTFRPLGSAKRAKGEAFILCNPCTKEGAFPAMLVPMKQTSGKWISCSSYIWAGLASAKLPAVEPHHDPAQTCAGQGPLFARKTRKAVLNVW